MKTTNDSLVVVFQSTSSIQRKTLLDFPSRHRRGFQSTSSIQRKTYPRLYSLYCWWHFNPLPLYRGRQRHKLKRLQRWVFQSTSSIQRKTLVIIPAIAYNIFQSTSSIQRKTGSSTGDDPCPCISIHFLYTEEDRKYQQMNILHQDILYLILTYKR